MGRKHRENRKSVKAALRLLGWKENEYGELTQRLSKSAARQYFLRMRQIKWEISLPELDLKAIRIGIVSHMADLVREELCASMDAEIFGRVL